MHGEEDCTIKARTCTDWLLDENGTVRPVASKDTNGAKEAVLDWQTYSVRGTIPCAFACPAANRPKTPDPRAACKRSAIPSCRICVTASIRSGEPIALWGAVFSAYASHKKGSDDLFRPSRGARPLRLFQAETDEFFKEAERHEQVLLRGYQNMLRADGRATRRAENPARRYPNAGLYAGRHRPPPSRP